MFQFAEVDQTTEIFERNHSGIKCLSTFQCTTEDEIHQIVLSYEIKSSPEDPIPAELLKNAVVLPLIKEMDDVMDNDVLKNYRPVSNLLFLEKLIEIIVSSRLNKHMVDNNLNLNYQFRYKKGHSTETLLVRVVNDLLLACDDNKLTILMLLDLSAAFNQHR